MGTPSICSSRAITARPSALWPVTTLRTCTLNSAFGKQTTQRSAHAKGVVLVGKFVRSAEGASVSKALHFKHEVPVTVRFSANSGIAKIADTDPRAAPRGLAIKFRLPDGSDTDLVTHSYN